MAKILLVDDDVSLCQTITDCLRFEHHEIETANTAREAFDCIRTGSYDLLILDWELPDATGLDICRSVRSKNGDMPILMLTAKSNIAEKVSGFDAGADDYLTKPFHFKELTVRVRALLRRPQAGEEQGTASGDSQLTVKNIVL